MGRITVHPPGLGEVEITPEELESGFRRFHCSNGRTRRDPAGEPGTVEWEHTGPCQSEGFLDVPLDDMVRWQAHLWAERWSITRHAGHNYESVHTLLFCCGPCHLHYLLREYREPAPENARAAAHVRMLLNI